MDAEKIFERVILPAWYAELPSDVPRAYVDELVRRRRKDFVSIVAAWLASQAPVEAAGVTSLEKSTALIEAPPDLLTPASRLRANLAAIDILAAGKKPDKLAAAERRTLLQYSDWGGLWIDKVRARIPEHLMPEAFSLLHGHYTPTIVTEAIADAVCPLLPDLAGLDRVVRVLEPCVGSGRFVRSLGPPRCVHPSAHVRGLQWITVERSALSSAVFTALHPQVRHHNMSFERFVHLHGAQYQGTINLILCNPPYGERGAPVDDDPDRDYREHAAFAYFMRRSLDLLVPHGLAVLLVPAGFLTGETSRPLRERVLRRHHLSAAFRLPSRTEAGRELFPGAAVVVDVLFWRSRGGELRAVDRDDRFIAEGRYFAEFPGHVLGETRKAAAGESSWRDAVVGDFTGLPELQERPLCRECVVRPVARPARNPAPEEERALQNLSEPQKLALALGPRVGRYLALLAADDADTLAQLWPELHAALVDFAALVGGNPRRYMPLRQLGRAHADAIVTLLGAFEPDGRLIPALAEPPRVVPRYTGQPSDVVAQAEVLRRQHRRLSLAQLQAFHAEQGGTLRQGEILEALFAAGWNLDGDAWDELSPKEVYLSGIDLWAKYDRARVRAAAGDERAKVQAKLLLEAIGPAVFEDLSEITPLHGYVPLHLISAFVSDVLNRDIGPVTLVRERGVVRSQGTEYGEQTGLAAETLHFLGWLNHDRALFRPPKKRRGEISTIVDRRAEAIRRWEAQFASWLSADPVRREALVEAYNRAYRGRIVPTYSTEPLEIARWGANAPVLMPHQIAGARRVLAAGKGLIAFDVGTGKTYTGIAAIGRARQEGWVRKPVVLVPPTIVWKWVDDFACTLPDYRVAVIGSKRKRNRDGELVAVNDTPEERAEKWRALQTGQVDVVILSYEALALTRLSERSVRAYIESVEAMQRSLMLRGRVTERGRAAMQERVAQWVRSMLRPPKGRSFDPGIIWDEIGIDMLLVDEAASFKNLHMPQDRDGGRPKFMGAGQEGSQRAWQLDLRAAAVRRRTGGSGVVLLTATPAKNSPLEFYNLFQFIDPQVFTDAGIYDPEQFIDRFLRIEHRAVFTSAFFGAIKPACVGFKNLDDLRTLILTYGEFRTATEVGIDLPRPVVERVPIVMDDEQERKYEAYVAEIRAALKGKRKDKAKILGLLARLSLVALHPALEDGYDYDTALEGGTAEMEVPKDEVAHWAEKGWVRVVAENQGEEAKEDDDEEEAEDDETVLMRRVLPKPVYETPKFVACAQKIAASAHCGHIVFCEPTATHQWIREVLVAHGIPRERIAVLNGKTASTQGRVDIARAFNGLTYATSEDGGACARPEENLTSPKYDVVICNEVAREGIDLQVRTCTIHHIDLPWTPSDLEQRNGRAIRKGNRHSTVTVYYYFAEGSTDGYRFDIIDGKANWLGDLLSSQIRDTNNPAAQQEMSPEEILFAIARDKEQMREVLEEKQRQEEEEARKKTIAEASRLLRQATARFREARETRDSERAARLRDEAETRLAELGRYNPEAWPWAPWVYAARDTDLVVLADSGAPLYEGLRVAVQREGEPTRYFEFGAVLEVPEGKRIGQRVAGAPRWTLIGADAELDLRLGDFQREGGATWPEDDEELTGKALALHIAQTLRGAGTLSDLGWRGASDAWLDHWWPRVAGDVASGLARSTARETAPVVIGGKLSLATGRQILEGDLLPPTQAGFRAFLDLAPASGLSFSALKAVGLSWWHRQIPQDLLSRAAVRRPAAPVEVPASAAPSAELSKPSGPEPTPAAAATQRRRGAILPPGLSLE